MRDRDRGIIGSNKRNRSDPWNFKTKRRALAFIGTQRQFMIQNTAHPLNNGQAQPQAAGALRCSCEALKLFENHFLTGRWNAGPRVDNLHTQTVSQAPNTHQNPSAWRIFQTVGDQIL